MLDFEKEIVFNGIFGSTLYGTNTPESDVDYKAIFIPSAKDIILGNGKVSYSENTSASDVKNTADDVDREFYSLQYFLNMAFKGETITIDMIHTPSELNLEKSNSGKEHYVWNFIKENRSKFYTSDMRAYIGYVKKQAAKYGIKGTRLAALRQVMEHVININDFYEDGDGKEVPTKILHHLSSLPLNEFVFFDKDDKGNEYYTVLGRKYQKNMKIKEFKGKIQKIWDEYGDRARKAEENDGIDWKALSHAYRGGVQLLEIYEKGDLIYPLKDANLIKDIKLGKIEFSTFQEMLEDVVSDVDKACVIARKNGMRDKVDVDFWNNFLYYVYKSKVTMG